MFEVALQYIKYYVSDSIIKIKKFSSLQQQTKMYIKSTYLYFDWKTAIYIYACGKCHTQFM
jgi:hypothetical protein